MLDQEGTQRCEKLFARLGAGRLSVVKFHKNCPPDEVLTAEEFKVDLEVSLWS